MWSRTANVNTFYPTHHVEGITSANIRFMCMDTSGSTAYEPRCADMMINSRTPGADATNTNILALLWDILGAIGVPTSTLEAIANGLTASVDVQEPTAYDNTIVIDAGLGSALPVAQTDLPSTVAYTNADYSKDKADSGLAAKFQYTLPKSHTNFKVWPQGLVKYLVETATFGSFYVSSGPAGVLHTVNTK